MAVDEKRKLVKDFVNSAKEMEMNIEEITDLIKLYYYVQTEEDELLNFRAKAEKIVAEMNSFSLTSTRYQNAVEILCIAYERKDEVYKRKEIAKELAKRKNISEITAYNLIHPIMSKFVSYLSGKSLYYRRYMKRGKKMYNAYINDDRVLKILVSHIEQAF